MLFGTVLRKCAEEIGLMADKVEVLWELDNTVTKTSNYININVFKLTSLSLF